MSTPFKTQQSLTAIALGFRNAGFIADQIAPRVPVASTEFKWTEYNTAEMFTIPNTMVGRKGTPNQVEFTSTEKTDSVVDYGLDDVVPNSDIEAAKNHKAIDPIGSVGAKLTELVALGREKRVADTVMKAANYNHSEVITGTDKWAHEDSKPIAQITEAMNTPMVEPNTMVLSKQKAMELRSNPQMLRAFHGNTGSDGLVPLSFIEELFDVKIIIGAAKYNAANKGQPMSLMQLYTGGCALIYIKPAAQLKDDVTFLLTAEHGGKVAGTRDADVGLRGGKQVRIGESLKEVLISKEAGFFLEGI
jgi:hypothetical protein